MTIRSRNIVVFFLEGKESKPDRSRDESEFFAWLEALQMRYPFTSATNTTLPNGLQFALNSWEQFVGSFGTDEIEIRLWRAYPDWGLEVHYSSRESLESFEHAIEPLTYRLFARPFHITVFPTSADLSSCSQPQYVTSRNASWQIHRTTQPYSSLDVHVGADERLIVAGTKDERYEQVLEAVLYIEYDLRIMHRNLLELVSLQPEVGVCQAQAEKFTLGFFYKRSTETNQDLGRQCAASLDESRLLLARITTLAADTFTAALDVLDYCVDLGSLLSDSNLVNYYVTQAELCYAKAKLLLTPIEWVQERLGYLSVTLKRS